MVKCYAVRVRHAICDGPTGLPRTLLVLCNVAGDADIGAKIGDPDVTCAVDCAVSREINALGDYPRYLRLSGGILRNVAFFIKSCVRDIEGTIAIDAVAKWEL